GTYLSRDELLVPLNLHFLSFRTALAVRNLLPRVYPQVVRSCRKRPWKLRPYPLSMLRRMGAVFRSLVPSACLKACPDTNPIHLRHSASEASNDTVREIG